MSRSALPTPPLAQALTQDGIGRTYGGQVLLRQELVKGFFGWVTYSLIRSERRDHPGSDWRLFDYDQTHVLGVLASYELGHGWEAGARFRYTTRHAAHAGRSALLRRATATLPAGVRRAELDPDPGLLPAGRARSRRRFVMRRDEARTSSSTCRT